MAADNKLVRIKPENNRLSHTAFGVTIQKEKAWHKVPAGIAAQLAEERMADNPNSPRVFDVVDQDEARELVEAENRKVEPAGTVEAPREVSVAADIRVQRDVTGSEGDAAAREARSRRTHQAPPTK